ncbi:helix-turn-helix domain-containing protein [Streptomyces glaucus]|uniref:HTH cro/C1-type domain-containing protein n=1 Tax=Streptomyces glaucus TaxID=284029 RepID=A0ABP5WSJ6_9ACTN
MPDELDPQIKEFTGQLRGLVDRSGLSIAAVADRTGYSKTSWERYLNGRLLAPKGAIVALAEVTGTNPVHLTTLWELAERAWSRSEMRHDMTMEAIRISQARAALGELAAPPADTRRAARKGGGAATPGAAGPAGAVPAVPAQPTAAESPDAVGGNSWRIAGYQGPAPSGRRPAAGASGEPPRRSAGSRGAPGGGRRAAMFVAGAVGAVGVIAGAFLLLGGGDRGDEGAAAPPSPSAGPSTALPAGVKCGGAACTGKDAEAMGCSGDLVTTARSATVGTTVVEVRYSRTCGAAWGRITGAAQGDEVEVSAGRAKQTGAVTDAGDTIAYTPMVAVAGADDATACVTLASGQKGCTR